MLKRWTLRRNTARFSFFLSSFVVLHTFDEQQIKLIKASLEFTSIYQIYFKVFNLKKEIYFL